MLRARSVKLIGRPLWIEAMAVTVQSPTSALTTRFASRAPAPAAAERQLEDAREGEAVRHVGVRRRFGRPVVGEVQHVVAIGELRIGVGEEHRVALREAPFQTALQRVIARRAVVAPGLDVLVRRERPEQLLALRVELFKPSPGTRPANGLGTLAVSRLIAAWSRAGDVLRYWRGSVLSFCSTVRSKPREPT